MATTLLELLAPIARSALVLTSPIAHRSFDLRTDPERRFIGTLLTDPPSDGLLDAPRSAWAYAHLADAPEMPVVER
jgi:hypothetical protein